MESLNNFQITATAFLKISISLHSHSRISSFQHMQFKQKHSNDVRSQQQNARLSMNDKQAHMST